MSDPATLPIEKVNALCGLPKPLPYVPASLDADKRLRRGERQKRCNACQRWRWPHELKACKRLKRNSR